MLYDLPDGPPIVVVGPYDTAWWAALGQPSAGRHALVIGDPTTPTAAVVIAGAITDLGAYLHPLHSTLVDAVQAAYLHHTEQPGTNSEPAGEPVPPKRTAGGPQHDADLIVLPHTGIRVPDATLRVTAYRELPTPHGVAYTATLRWGNIPVGTLHNEGLGGLTTYRPAAGTPFDDARLDAFVAASRTADGQPFTEEATLLEELVTEFENVEHVTSATRAGRSPIRLQAPLGDGLDDIYYTALRNTVPKVTTPAQRDALRAALTWPPEVDGGWWQLWTGQAWEDLTLAPAPDPDTEDPR